MPGRPPPTPPPTTSTWLVRVEGSVGKGTARRMWRSEAHRIVVRPLAPGNDGTGFPIPYLK
jgi:hypothetical protein